MVLTLGSGHKILFQLLGVYELHFNIVSDDYSSEDWMSFYLLQLNANVTKNNQLSIRADLEQRYIADEGEVGLWFGDMRFQYSRKFVIPIPEFDIPGKLSLYLTAPTSRASRERSYITKPTAVLKLAPSLGPLTLAAIGYFRYSAAEYAESSERGTLNSLFNAGYELNLTYQPLDWLGPYFAWRQDWDRPYNDRENTDQPWLGSYGFEFGVDFSIPMPSKGPSLDLILAFDQGANLLEEGVYRLYFAKRDQSEIYLGINLVY